MGVFHSSDILSIRFKHTRIIRFFGLLKKYLKILDHRCLWVWAQLKLSLLNVLLIVFTYFTYSHFQNLKYLKILLFEHLRKIRVFRMSLLWSFQSVYLGLFCLFLCLNCYVFDVERVIKACVFKGFKGMCSFFIICMDL